MNLSDIDRRWLVANMIPTVIAAALMPLVYLTGKAMGIPGAGASFSAQAFFVALQAALTAFYLTFYAHLIGSVLRTNIPAFPHRSWTRAHLVAGLIVGAVTGLAMLTDVKDMEPMDWSDMSTVGVLLLTVTILGAVVDLGIGSFQALLLRDVAQGLGLWVLSWTLAICVGMLIGGGLQWPFSGPRSLTSEMVTAGATIVVGLVGAIMLLPALGRLRPKV